VRRWAALTLAAAVVACLPRPSGEPSSQRGPVVRVALAAVPRGDAPTDLLPGRDGLVRFRGKAYRGALRTVPTDSGLLVINVVPLEDYLLGVVPLELGERPASERAALEAQAIAARSYTITRVSAARSGRGRSTDFDLVSSTSDQVYGGHGAEQPNASAAVLATRGQVLRYGDGVIVAPYHSTCGGETAAAEEVWRSNGEPYLRRVSDRMPGREERYYCDIAPRFYWERTLTGAEIDATVARYLAAYARVPAGGPGSVRSVEVQGRTPSGRVAALRLSTTAGSFEVRGNDARSVVRSGAGELLPSSYFSVSVEPTTGGGIARVVLKGNGFGHGVGMCQWGAIGRARAGHDARTILRTYFPGTTIGPIPSRYLTS
jgi:stage II sporulation protein D